VLVAGGTDTSGSTATADLYDAAAGRFNPTGSMTVARNCHTATLLADQQVLVVGGIDDNSHFLASAELYQ
jgi:hypothetical protein